MILSAHQPAYLPWLGYFEKLIKSDMFIFLDSVQYEKNSFTNRNKIKTPQGEMWLSIPVYTKGHMSSELSSTQIDNRQAWKKKHLRSIHANYKKVLRFEECYTKLETLYEQEYDLLSDLCWYHLLFWLKELGINTKIIRSSQLNIESKKSDLIFDLCSHFRAEYYISGVLGRNYLKEEKFKQAGIEIEYQDYTHPVYPQLWEGFLPNMSIVDFWMNTDQYALIMGGK